MATEAVGIPVGCPDVISTKAAAAVGVKEEPMFVAREKGNVLDAVGINRCAEIDRRAPRRLETAAA